MPALPLANRAVVWKLVIAIVRATWCGIFVPKWPEMNIYTEK